MELPAGWTWTRLGNVVEVLDHQRVPVSAKERAQRPGDVPYYGATGQVGWIDTALFDEELALLGEDGVQFFDRGKPKAYVISGPAWVNNHAHVLRVCRDVTLARFVVHYLNTFNYEGYVNGTTRLKLTKSSMTSIPVPLPPLAEQQRIVEALDDHLSRSDAATRSLIDAGRRLTSLRTSLLASILADGELPVGWTSSTIGELANVGTGATPLKSRSEYYDGGTIPWVTSSLLNSSLITKPEKYITDLAVQETSVKIYPAGTILVAMYGEGKTRGKSAELAFPATTNQACAAIVLHGEEEFRKPWIKLALEAQYIKLRRLSAGGVQPNLNLGLIRKIEIALPPRSEQEKILAQMDNWSIAMERLRVSVARLQARGDHLQKSIVERAIGGQLVPQSPADEPASVLLNRSCAERETHSGKGKPKRVTRSRQVTAAAAVMPAPPPPAHSTDAPINVVQQELPL
ncbi:restriction endonuclease subunit S [Streptomyces sp. b94]|uniref:restriction endonuclease subunit S n=1 Tax=Streptomyces sp. b94 TaxID=1827634 RepID=UPI001B38A08D|nr:restriction endonuclease subunit S [Streptomyces sp. b94]MBQ1098648.1 restriction endonuclease subunit S [Streptomyces sp. b94]